MNEYSNPLSSSVHVGNSIPDAWKSYYQLIGVLAGHGFRLKEKSEQTVILRNPVNKAQISIQLDLAPESQPR
jgi:hypothetical protein